MLEPFLIKEEPEDVKPDLSTLLPAVSSADASTGNDDDCWAQPLFTYKELGILAVMNTDSKQLSQDGIGHFIEKHFPFYKYEPDFTGCKLRTSGGFQKVQDDNGEWVYQLDTSQLDHALKKFHKFYRCYPDPSSKVYSMRYPQLWDDMMKGQYREGKSEVFCLPSTSLNPSENDAVPIVYLKPPIPERFLLALALLNAPDDCMPAQEIFAFVKYHFPYYGNQTNWNYVGFRTLNAAKGIFDRKKTTKKGKAEKGRRPQVYSLIEDRLPTMAEFMTEFIVKYPDPKHYGMRNPELWEDMLRGNLKNTPFHQHLIERVEGELAEQPAQSDEEMGDPSYTESPVKKKKRKYAKRARNPEGIPAEELLGLISEETSPKRTKHSDREHSESEELEPAVKQEIAGELEPPCFPDLTIKMEQEDPTIPKAEDL